MKRKDTRPLTVNGQLWEYKIGRNTVAIYDPEGKRYFPRFEDIHSQKVIDAGQGYLNPATILNHILVKILGGEPKHHRCNYCKIPKADVTFRCDPFDAEIHENYTKHYICDECIAFREDEI